MEEEIIKKRAKVIIVSEEASERTKEKFRKLCLKYSVPIIIDGNIEELSKAIGKDNKAIYAVKESNLAKEIERIYNGGEFIG